MHVLQVLMMTNGEKDLLANHLAHNLHTHNRYYKIQEAALSLAKVSRLLIAAEEGELQKYSGKKLEDIDITGNAIQNKCFSGTFWKKNFEAGFYFVFL